MRWLFFITTISLLISCRQDRPSPATDHSTADVATVEGQTDPELPPPELLRGNYDISSHVAVMKVESLAIEKKIYADDGTLGYIVHLITGKLIRTYKGEFDQHNEITYTNFLEYSPELENATLDTVLVFLKQDIVTHRFHAIEVGQFRFSDSLGKMIENIAAEQKSRKNEQEER